MSSAVPTPALSVVIPTRNGEKRIGPTLRAIADQDVGAPVEVIVVDDGSTDRSGEKASSIELPFGRCRVIRHSPSLGRAAACNRGVEAARAGLVVLLDDDMTLQPGALAAHQALHSSAREPVAALGRIALPAEEKRGCFARFLAREDAHRERLLSESPGDVSFVLFLTGHLSISRAAFLAAGGFDDRIRWYGFEDIEFGYRLSQRGILRRYLPEAESIHRTEVGTLDHYLSRQSECGRVAAQLARRYPDGPFRDYLRVDPPPTLGVGRDPIGLVGMRVSNRMLLHPRICKTLASPLVWRMLQLAIRAGERVRLDRLVHFAYYFARDVRYFDGYFAEVVEHHAS